MEDRQIEIKTSPGASVTDLTDACRRFLSDAAGDRDGMLLVFVPHATAGLVVMELGSDSEDDLLATLERLLPRDDRWRHRHGSPGHGADHLLPMLFPPSLALPVAKGSLNLGTWQSVALVDTNRDNPHRRVRLAFLSG